MIQLKNDMLDKLITFWTKVWDNLKSAFFVKRKFIPITFPQLFTEMDMKLAIALVKPADPGNNPSNPTTIGKMTKETGKSEAIMTERVEILNPTPKSKEQAFIEALSIAVVDKFDPLIVYTQCYHETDNFRKLIGEWNYAGCKPPHTAISPVPIKEIERLTHEVINGISRLVKDTFADFNSADDFMRFYMWQIQRLYKESYENRNSPIAYFYWLTRGINKWATDTDYSAKLEKLYAELKANGIYEKLNRALNNV